MDIYEIKDLFSENPEELLDSIGIEYKRQNGRLLILCPFHSDNHLGSAMIYNGNFHCFSCGTSSDCIGLVEQILKIPFIDAVNYCAAIYGLNVTVKADPFKEYRLTKDEKKALDFPVTKISISRILEKDSGVYKKIILEQASKMIAHYRNLDKLYGSRDGDRAYIFGEYCENVSPIVFADIHKSLSQNIKTLNNLIRRF
jgi:hypothetical protein